MTRMQKLAQLLILSGILASLALASPALQAAPQRALEVLADEVEMELETGVTHFRNNVRIVMQDYRISCQSATVRLHPKTRQLQEIVMRGSVLLQSKDGLLRGKKVTFLAGSNRLRLEGSVYTRIQVNLPQEFNP